MDSSPVDPTAFTEVDDWLDAALDQPAEERRAFLDRECSDADVRRRVERLLARLETEAGWMRSGAGLGAALDAGLGVELGTASAAPEDDALPPTLGPFRIERVLGQGGMGVVYLAHREGPDYEQRIALKVLRQGADSPTARLRFARERRILASLGHPHVAGLVDGGYLPDGRPYLAMEHVEGRSIDRYCNEERIDPRGRIDLFLAVARAVAHAHRRLVVHRDIKAANILVDAEGQPRLLDFGIAALTEDDSATGSLTLTRHQPMTPAFASPEQLSGEAITTASDVYQLGLLLYGLLTGRWPYPRVEHESDPRRAILESPPVAASRALESTRTSTTAPLPGTELDVGLPPARLRRWLEGDLDKILGMALRKEPERRYRSVEALVDDLEAFLEDRPVLARADAPGYRLGKWLRRHRMAVGIALVSILVLGTAAIVHTVRLGEERDRAQREALRAGRTADFMADLFLAADPVAQGPEPPSVRELLDRGAESLLRGLDEEPRTRARLMAQMADIYFSLGVYDRAEELVRPAILDFERSLGEDHPETLGARHRLAAIWLETDRFWQAEMLLRRVVDRRRDVLGTDHPSTLDSTVALAAALGTVEAGLHPEAERLLRAVLEEERWQGNRHRHPVADWLRLAETLMRLGDDRACALYSEMAQALETDLGAEHPQTARVQYNLAVCRWHVEGRADAAIAPLERAIEARRTVLGEAHHRTLEAIRLLGTALLDLGRATEAEAIFRDAVEVQRGHGLRSDRWLRTELAWTDSLLAIEAPERASAVLEEVLEAQPFDARIHGDLACRLAASLAADGQLDAARSWWRRLAAVPRPGVDPGCDPVAEMARVEPRPTP